MVTVNDPIQKVAILVSALDQRSADTVLEQMSGQQAELVRNALLELDNVPPEVVESIVQEFLDGGAAVQAEADGVEVDPSLSRMFGAEAESPPLPPTDFPSDEPFRFVHEARADTLAGYLEQEHPQVIGIVLAHLPPQRAAAVLTRLPNHLQADVVTRIAHPQDADPVIVREVENGLKSGLSDRLRQDTQRAAGVSAVQSILEATDDIARSELLGSVASLDPELAKHLGNSTSTPFPATTSEPSQPPSAWNDRLRFTRGGSPEATAPTPTPRPSADSPSAVKTSSTVKPRPAPRPTVSVHFEDFSTLDDFGLAMVFERAEPHIAFLALAGAPIALVERIMSQLSPQEARGLRRRIENIGPIRLLDVELAQRKVAQHAAELIAEGKLGVPRRKLSVAA